MKKSIFLKIFGGYLFLGLLLTALILLFSFKAIKNFYIGSQVRHLELLADTLKFRVNPLLEENRFKELDSFAKEFGKEIKTRITVVSKEGVVLADSEENPEKMESHRYRPEIFQALEGRRGQSLRFSSTVGADMLYVAVPIEKGGETSGALRLSLFLKDIDQLLAQLRRNIIGAVVVITVILLVAALIFSRSLSSPIRELISASHKVARGDFDVRIFIKKRDELKDLSESFNWMTSRLKALFTELSQQREELDGIISSIQEGLLVLDRNERILLSNQSFKKIIQNDTPEGRFYWEVFRRSKFDELIKRVREQKKSTTGEVQWDERVYLCSATYMATQERIVVTFHDVTEAKNMERMKRDFVVNVSHELRTPLTSIKGYVETLEGKLDKKSQNYLEIIKRNAERLINIVEDLLLLSELEEKGVKLELEEVDVRQLAEDVLKIFEKKARDKGLNLTVRAKSGLPSVRADRFRLEQMFINLIDNALKYTEKGGIGISLEEKENALVIEIEDTGIGISEEHLPRIFERFYVVEKSRSRSLGGTGLGLSIVKHIVLLHNGKIDVQSRPGAGTKFTITLPFTIS